MSKYYIFSDAEQPSSCMGPGWIFPQYTVQNRADPDCGEKLSPFIHFLFYSIPKGCFHENLLMHCWTKARHYRRCNWWYQMGADSPVLVSCLSSSCSPGTWAAQHGPEDHPGCAAWYSTGLHLLTLAVIWVTTF